MLRTLIIVSVFGVLVCGCSVDETIRQNAYVHNKTAEMAKAVAAGEEVSALWKR